ncbi:hypothetical protein [Aurantibacter aestuarii]|uniref:Uncharacterized protein n=1 Tax=Aurantibacter aestuarii TaxID=1266046 RepID=A0A2T1NC52_9FLAO|nr:hypothetical protein [Aurantibacter aestuarii]PSG90023.1 hypothetical protein C7H52_01765 [Aurantibacter aestuarii]
MLNFIALIQTTYTNAYKSAYDLTLKKEFSTPKIYTANNDATRTTNIATNTATRTTNVATSRTTN